MKKLSRLFSTEHWRDSYVANAVKVGWILLYIWPAMLLRSDLPTAILLVYAISVVMHFLHYISQCLQVHGRLLFIRWFRKNQLVNVQTGEKLVDEVRRGLPSCWLLVKHWFKQYIFTAGMFGVLAIAITSLARMYIRNDWSAVLIALNCFTIVSVLAVFYLRGRRKRKKKLFQSP